MKIGITVTEETVVVEMDDCPAARDFVSLLPLELVLVDYEATEKIADLPRPLCVDEAPPGTTPKADDFAFYAPWGNIAVFLKDFEYSEGLVKLGSIVSGSEHLQREGALPVTFNVLGP